MFASILNAYAESYARRPRHLLRLVSLVFALTTCASAQVPRLPATELVPIVTTSSDILPIPAVVDDPSGNGSSSSNAAGAIVKTVASDEWHIIKSPSQAKAIKWDLLIAGATGALVATDEHVMHQVPAGWHQPNLNISDGATYGTAAVAAGIYLTGLATHNEHAQETGMRTAEATMDSVILYGAMKAIFQRQRPYTGEGEGAFFAGNWTNGSFPSGHAMFTWTIASTVAHQYHSLPLRILLYGAATTVSVTRVTSGEHFPSDVLVGSVFGYLIGAYVSNKPAANYPIRSQNRLEKVQQAILQHVTIGVQ